MKNGKTSLLLALFLSVGVLTGIFIGSNLKSKVVSLDAPNTSTTASFAEDSRIDLNEATANVLMELPGIGETLAERIVAYRQENGKFSTADELLNVEGIGLIKLEQIEHLIKVGG